WSKMRSKFILFLLGTLVLAPFRSSAQPQSGFKLTGKAVARPGDAPVIDAYYTNQDPDENAPYMAREHLNEFWKVKWSAKPDSAATSVQVNAITLSKEVKSISSHVRGNLPPDATAAYWTVLFLPSDNMPALPQLASTIPRKVLKRDCDSQNANAKPNF